MPDHEPRNRPDSGAAFTKESRPVAGVVFLAEVCGEPVSLRGPPLEPEANGQGLLDEEEVHVPGDAHRPPPLPLHLVLVASEAVVEPSGSCRASLPTPPAAVPAAGASGAPGAGEGGEHR